MGLIGKVLKSFLEDEVREISMEIYEGYIREARQILPPGIDANPLPDDQGVMIEIDGSSGKAVQIGVYPDPKAKPGEIRFYSRDNGGVEKGFLWIRDTGEIQINGDADNAVRYTELESAFNQLKTDFDNLISVFNLHTHTYNPGPSAPAPTLVPNSSGSSSTADITGAKVDEVKLP